MEEDYKKGNGNKYRNCIVKVTDKLSPLFGKELLAHRTVLRIVDENGATITPSIKKTMPKIDDEVTLHASTYKDATSGATKVWLDVELGKFVSDEDLLAGLGLSVDVEEEELIGG